MNMNIAGPTKLVLQFDDVFDEDFQLYFFEFPQAQYYVVKKGDIDIKKGVLVRLHSACNIGHIFHSQRCDCQAQLTYAIRRLHAGGGLLLYALHHEGRGVGPFDHVRVYQQQDTGLDTVESYEQLDLPIDNRTYIEAERILRWFKADNIILLTNNPKKIEALQKMGFAVADERIITAKMVNDYNRAQLVAKREKLGHIIHPQWTAK